MKKGYQLICIHGLDDLTAKSRQLYLFVILHWLIGHLNKDLKEPLKDAQLEIIKAQYTGDAYPTIAIHYFNKENPRDVGPLVESAIEKLLKESPIVDFAQHAARRDINWDEELARVMENG